MAFPYDRDTTVAEVDAFMARIGLTHTVDELRQHGMHAVVSELRHYHFDFGDRRPARHPGPRALTFIKVAPENASVLGTWQRWLTELRDEIGSVWVPGAATSHYRQFQLLAYVANRVESLGYPRESAAFTAYLYTRHLPALDLRAHLGRTHEEALRQYAYLANEARLTLAEQLEAAERGFPLGDLSAHLDAGVPFPLLRDLLTSTKVKPRFDA